MEENSNQIPESQNVEQIIQNPIAPRKSILSLPVIILVAFFIIVFIAAGYILLMRKNQPIGLYNQSPTSVSPTPAQFLKVTGENVVDNRSSGSDTITLVQKSTPYLYDLKTKQYQKISGIDDEMAEAGTNLSGHVLYYYSNPFPSTSNPSSYTYPRKVTILTAKYKKVVDFGGSNLWSLSSYNRELSDFTAEYSCFLAPNGKKLACSLDQRESAMGGGTGISKLVVYDIDSEKLDEILTTDKVYKPEGSRATFSFIGWRGNEELLFIHINGYRSPTTKKPTDFYTVNINTKSVVKQFSYQYNMGGSIVISSDSKQMIFASFDRDSQRQPAIIKQLVRYIFDTKQTEIIPTSSEVFDISHYILSVDNSRLIYSTALDSLLHVHQLDSKKEITIKMPESIFAVGSVLPDNKTFIVNKTRDNAALFNSETREFENLNGIYIGSGF